MMVYLPFEKLQRAHTFGSYGKQFMCLFGVCGMFNGRAQCIRNSHDPYDTI